MKNKAYLTKKWLLASFCPLLAIPAKLFSIDVTSTLDTNTIGTLPYAIINSKPGDTIDCTPIAGQKITLTQSLPAVTKDLTLLGAGVTIDGQNSYCAFQIASGTVTIDNFNILNALCKGGDGGDGDYSGGGAVGGGGALYIHGGTAVTISNATLSYNQVQGGNGGNNASSGYGGGGGAFGGGKGGNGGFGAGGGGGVNSPGIGRGGYGAGGGNGGGPAVDSFAGGGGGAGLGGAIFVQKGAILTVVDAKQIYANSAIAGLGGRRIGGGGSSGQHRS